MKTIDINPNGEFNVAFGGKLGAAEGLFEGHWPIMAERGDVLHVRGLGKNYRYEVFAVAQMPPAWATVRVVLIDSTDWSPAELMAALLERDEICNKFSRCISAIMQNHAELRAEINSRMGWKS